MNFRESEVFRSNFLDHSFTPRMPQAHWSISERFFFTIFFWNISYLNFLFAFHLLSRKKYFKLWHKFSLDCFEKGFFYFCPLWNKTFCSVNYLSFQISQLTSPPHYAYSSPIQSIYELFYELISSQNKSTNLNKKSNSFGSPMELPESNLI